MFGNLSTGQYKFCLVVMRTSKSREKAFATRVISAFPAFVLESFFHGKTQTSQQNSQILPSSFKEPTQ